MEDPWIKMKLSYNETVNIWQRRLTESIDFRKGRAIDEAARVFQKIQERDFGY